MDNFFKTGGNLSPEDPSYIARRADAELLGSLIAGEFCYLLDSRQVGKSSLMVRTVQKLRANDRQVCVIDLQSLGNNLDQNQWYAGLLYAIGKTLGCADELEESFERHKSFGPFQRWMTSFDEAIVPRLGDSGRLVIFVDEIDIVRSLKFNADEFFLGIREMHNKRSLEPTYRNITFCLLGSASPADLIQDKTVTPFNIGHRIELTDFTEEEAAPLAAGLNYLNSEAPGLLKRCLYWTNGHPYLTQKLCGAIASEQAKSAAQVDAVCGRLFLSREAKDIDPNLSYARDRVLRGSNDRVTVLLMLKQAQGTGLAVDESSDAQTVLRLSGIVRNQNRVLEIRNRIYQTVFDEAWINSNLPEREVVREVAAQQSVRRATRKVTRVAVLAVLLALAGLSVGGYVLYHRFQFQKMKETTVLNVKSVDLGLLMYSNDFDDAFPPMSEPDVLKQVTMPYVKNDATYFDAWGISIQPNTSLSFHNSSQLEDVAGFVSLYQAWTPDDGTRAVGFADGHAKNMLESDFNASLSKSTLPPITPPGAEAK